MNLYFNSAKEKKYWFYPDLIDATIMNQIWDYTKQYNIFDLFFNEPQENSVIILGRIYLHSFLGSEIQKKQLLSWKQIKNKKIILLSNSQPFISCTNTDSLLEDKKFLVDTLEFEPKNIMYIVQIEPDIKRVREVIGQDTWVTAYDRWAEELFRYQIRYSVLGKESYLKPNANLPKKPFSLFIRRYEDSRFDVICELIKNNLLDYFHYTFAGRWGHQIQDDVFAMIRDYIDTKLPQRYQSYKPAIVEWMKGIPYSVDKIEDMPNGIEEYESLFTHSLNDYYNGSFINVVLETDYISLLDITSDVSTEKTYKAMFFKKPFIIIGKPKSLDILKQRGFKTFSHVINESYDNIEDNYERLGAIAAELNRIKNFNDAELESLVRACHENIEHNYQLLIETCTQQIPKEFGIANFTKTW